MPDPVDVEATLRGANITAGAIAVPASLLAGLGAPFNTLDLDGNVRLARTPWRVFGTDAFGRLTVTLGDMSSRVSLVKPLGSYEAVLQAQGASSTRSEDAERAAAARRPRHLLAQRVDVQRHRERDARSARESRRSAESAGTAGRARHGGAELHALNLALKKRRLRPPFLVVARA
jgi:hypothetical protein